jgi:Flp pilus assembly protein TadD
MNPSFDDLLNHAMQAAAGDRLGEANNHLQAAMELQPQSPVPYFLMGANFAQKGMNDQAEAAWVACLSRAPAFGVARFQLGLLQLTSGRPASAQATWEPLLSLPADHYLKSFVLGFVAILRGEKDEAERCIGEGIRQNRENPPLNQDMEALLGRLSSDIPPVEALADSPASSHFLMSAYNKPQ